MSLDSHLVSQNRPDKSKFQVFALHGHNARIREYKRRRLHARSNSGCLTCRAKRVKCDESKPVCIRCHRNDRLCTYGKAIKGKRPSNGGPSILSAVTVVPFSSPSAQNGTPSIHLMQHLEQNWADIFNIRGRDTLMELSKSHSLVRNALLAVSACHLRHVSPGVLQHRIAEHFQQTLVIHDCRRLILLPPAKLSQAGVNSLLVSTMLLNMLAFTLPESDNNTCDPEPKSDRSTSCVFSPDENRLGWLALQAGMRPMLKATGVYLEPAMSLLSDVFLDPEDDSWTPSRLSHGLEGIPVHWIKFFNLEGGVPAPHGPNYDNGSSENGCEVTGAPTTQITPQVYGNIFRPAVITLLRLLKSHRHGRNFNIFKALPFLSKVRSELRTLLYLRDERALWLFGCWLGLLSRHGAVWWCEKRVRRDYKAICMWLDQARVTSRPGREGEIWKEMMTEFDNLAVACDA